ncbi:hypothetical protein BCR33DRAFT_715207 [Rhizoclosmatium globosum]|uniref:Cilia- and flagella-associated protein 299 n=1 Tax=Rhizoclosmatium globosum TaxID=329046 RepID=A0A1Y2CI82_9FUNG|nr:hypothetical protein BCR33DRAFT_715207 [Rhizoclosmatium globosum]|eukprot:ORY46761.1 hypothetical protein BCR33DRAFT_715207 [Rhizoclosmatium globosum]
MDEEMPANGGDATITPIDLYYLEDKELARQLPLKREEFESRKKASETFRLSKRLATKVLASQGKDLTGFPFLQALAEREEANRSGKLTSILFIRTLNGKGQEISGYIDYAHRLKTENFESIFGRTRGEAGAGFDKYILRWSFHTTRLRNFQVIADNENGILFKNKRDRKLSTSRKASGCVINCLKSGKQPRRQHHTCTNPNKEHIQVVIYDHLTRRKA